MGQTLGHTTMGPSVCTWSRTGFGTDREKISADRVKEVLVLTGLVSGDAGGEVLRSKIEIDSNTLNEFVFAPDEETFMDAMGSLLPTPGQAWSTRMYYVGGAQSHPTGD